MITPDQVKALRERLGMSQTEFGNTLGKSARTVRAWESGSPIQPDGRALIRAAEYIIARVKGDYLAKGDHLIDVLCEAE